MITVGYAIGRRRHGGTAAFLATAWPALLIAVFFPWAVRRFARLSR
ncbi:hypothetical protein ACWGI8_28990 [Streptomyces sp. NPDC054841]